MTRRRLLLDIDGVLNDGATCAAAPPWWGPHLPPEQRVEAARRHIEPALAAIVRRVVERTGCEVIVCSTWRIMPHGLTLAQLRDVLGGYHIPCRGATRQPLPSEWGNDRRLAPIRSMIHTDPAARWVVLDDQVLPGALPGLAGLVAVVTPDDGVTETDAAAVIAAMEG